MDIVDLFASQYGWTRDYIFDHVYIDEYFSMLDSIRNRKRQENIMKAYMHLLPNMKEENRRGFLDQLFNDDGKPKEEMKTDFERLDILKSQMNK